MNYSPLPKVVLCGGTHKIRCSRFPARKWDEENWPYGPNVDFLPKTDVYRSHLTTTAVGSYVAVFR